jgi:hypothetical protein
MDEILYSIEIYKDDSDFYGKIFSDNNEIKEFKNKNIDELLRDIILDIELDHDESSSRHKDFFEDAE